MKFIKSNAQTGGAKLAYHTPHLTVHGDVATLTKGYSLQGDFDLAFDINQAPMLSEKATPGARLGGKGKAPAAPIVPVNTIAPVDSSPTPDASAIPTATPTPHTTVDATITAVPASPSPEVTTPAATVVPTTEAITTAAATTIAATTAAATTEAATTAASTPTPGGIHIGIPKATPKDEGTPNK